MVQKIVRKKIVLWTGGAILLLAIGATCLFLWQQEQQKDLTDATDEELVVYGDATKDIRSAASGDSTARYSQIYQKYHANYAEILREFYASDATKWVTDQVDKAHFLLVYAGEIGASNELSAIAAKIQRAEESGIDVDGNSAGITKSDRDAYVRQAAKGADQ